MNYKTRIQPRFNEADSAGLIFFANAYVYAHVAFEKFVVEELGYQWEEWFNNPDWALPLRHTECEHLIPIFPGSSYDVSVGVERVGESSFTLKYSIETINGVHAVVTMVHTFFDLKTSAKARVPDWIRDGLEAYQSKSRLAK